MRVEPATEDEIKACLDELGSWILREGKLHREYKFKNFIEAFGFMTSAALVAERQNHHPEWCNVYKTVVVDLITHEVAAVTERDFFLAREMERLALPVLQK